MVKESQIEFTFQSNKSQVKAEFECEISINNVHAK